MTSEHSMPSCNRSALVCPAIRWAEAEIERLRAIEKAARAYYLGYCQDEADEEGICDLEQQRAAQALRDAIRNADA